MGRNISVIVPFQTKKQCGIEKLTLSCILFAKKILDKYKALGIYGFDDAAMVFLEQFVEDEKQDKDIRKQIELTVKMMMFRQNRNHLAKQIINENTAFQKNITSHIMVNLNRLLSVDKRVYSELNQISNQNVKIREAYNKIEKLESYEKKLIFQVQSQQTIKPKTLQRSIYQIYEQILKQSQTKLSTQLFKESAERKQFKYNLDRLLELQTFRNDVEKHEFLHVMQYGTLEERREAMEVLKNAILEVQQEVTKKSEEHSISDRDSELLLLREFSRGKNISPAEQLEIIYHRMKEVNLSQTNLYEGMEHRLQERSQLKIRQYEISKRRIEEKNQLHVRQLSMTERRIQEGRLLQERQLHTTEHRLQEERILQIAQSHKHGENRQQSFQNKNQEREIIQIKQLLQQQQTNQTQDHKMYEEIRYKLISQEHLITQVIKEQSFLRKQGSSAVISEVIAKRLKSEIHLDKMRYGIE